LGLPRTAAALVTLPTATVGLGLPAIAIGALGGRRIPERLTRSWCDLVLTLAGADVRTTGLERLDPNRTYVFVANHQSHMDAPSIIRAWPGPIRFVAKKSLFRVPVFGQALWALGHIAVDRGDSARAQARLAREVDTVRHEISVLFFAEGTRSLDGSLGRFKKGCLAMAEAAGVPVVPVAVTGTRKILGKHQAWLESGRVGVAFGAPMPEAGDASRSRDARIAEVRAAVVRLLEEAEAVRQRDPAASLG
jgi:1-acyl-sn-glycerol-3-phosphate acyltransferase